MKMTDAEARGSVDELLAKLTADIDAETQAFLDRRKMIETVRPRSREDEDEQRREVEAAYEDFMRRTAPLRQHREHILMQRARIEIFAAPVQFIVKEKPPA